MAEFIRRGPVDDSSDVVIHARQTTFVMVFVCTITIAGVLVQDTDRWQRALVQMDHIIALMNHLKQEALEHPSRSLATIIAGVGSTQPKSFRAYELTLTDGTMSNHRSDQIRDLVTRAPSVREFECTIGLDFGQYFFVNDSGLVEHITLERDSASEREWQFRSLSFGSRYKKWEVPGPPRDLSEFAVLWDTLVTSRYVARIRMVEPTSGLGIDMDGTFYFGDISEIFYQVQKVEVLNVLSDKMPGFDTGIVQLDEKGLENLETVYKYPPAVVSNWKDSSVKRWSSGKCYENINDQAHEGPLVMMPAKLYHQRFDWISAWTHKAIQKNHLPPGAIVDSRLFAQAFGDLNREATYFLNVEFDNLRDWLQHRIDTEGKSIGILGITIQLRWLSFIGIILIVTSQIYAKLHIEESVSRMTNSAVGDPGAFKPWIMLYGGKPAIAATFCVIYLPPLAAAVVVINSVGGDWILTLSNSISCISLAVSFVLSFVTYNWAGKLRRKARSHLASHVNSSAVEP